MKFLADAHISTEMVAMIRDLGDECLDSFSCPGVVLIRVALADEADRVAYVRSIWPTELSRLPGSFITITLSGIRARPMP